MDVGLSTGHAHASLNLDNVSTNDYIHLREKLWFQLWYNHVACGTPRVAYLSQNYIELDRHWTLQCNYVYSP